MRLLAVRIIIAVAVALGAIALALFAIDAVQDEPFEVGAQLVTSDNVQVFGTFHFAESCSYDAERDLFVVPSAGILHGADGELVDDGYVSLIYPDGTVHTSRWIGVNRNGLTLNHPFGSDIMNGVLYLADRDTVRLFDMETGAPVSSVVLEAATWLNDLEVAEDGTIYATQTGTSDDASSWRIYKITADGEVSVFFEGAPLKRPNGIALDPDGNIVVINIGDNAILTFSPAGDLLSTGTALDSVNDGLVILPDGTMIVSSVGVGSLSVIGPGAEPELVASGIPSAASICYDPTRNRVMVPMNGNNAVSLVDLN